MKWFNTHWKTVTKILPIYILTGALLIVTSMSSTGCEKEVEKIVTDTLTVTVNDTITIISVYEITANPDSIAVGGTITLTAKVTTELDPATLSYYWYADAGEYDSNTGDTVSWKAPDDAGSYKVFVHVTDNANTYIGIGNRLIGVGMYAPTTTPYFVSEDECSGCHGSASGSDYNIYEAYSQTGHANAVESLMSSDHVASYCFPCHTVGYAGYAFGDTSGGDSGYDEAPIAKFENVQCENCHGPASDHISGPSKENITRSWDATVCGSCHSGTHNPFLEEWETSGHNTVGYATGRSSCQGCHEGVAASIRLSGDLSELYTYGAIDDRPVTDEQPLTGIACATCHSPHQADKPHQLRTVADVQLVDANQVTPDPVTDGGLGKVCMQCHHARRSADTQLDAGYAHFGPHGSTQGDMIASESAYLGVADASFTWAAPTHLYIENSCVTCHMYMREYDSSLDPSAIKGHSFKPTVKSCEKCHGSILDFEEIMAQDDFDGDGNVESVYAEVDGLLATLKGALVDSFAVSGIVDTTGIDLAHELGIVTHFNADSTDSLVVPRLWREAGYNWVFVTDDGSHGIHNPDYAVQLLQQSYKYLTGSLPLNAVPHYGDRSVVVNW